MKKHVVTASLLAGFSMISGNAFAQTGTLGASFSHIDTDFGDADVAGVNGGAAFQMGGNLAVLVDGTYTTSDDTDTDVLTGTGHLIARDANGAFGGFVGLGNVDSGGGDVDLWTAGGEYAAFYDNSTFVATLAYANVDDVDVNIWGLNGEYRIFSSNNLRFDLGAGLARVDAGGSDSDAWQVGAGVEYRFEGTPFSLGGNVQYIDGDASSATIVGATLRFDFGNDSLKSRDRTGNTFGSFGGLSQYLN